MGSRGSSRLTTRQALVLVFDDLRSHGVDARSGFAGTDNEAAAEIGSYLSAEFPDAIGSWVVWLESDAGVFASTGSLTRPLRLHCSAMESADITLLLCKRHHVRAQLGMSESQHSVIVFGMEPSLECEGHLFAGER